MSTLGNITQLISELIEQQNILENKLEQFTQIQLEILQEIKNCKTRLEKLETINPIIDPSTPKVVSIINPRNKVVSELTKPWKQK